MNAHSTGNGGTVIYYCMTRIKLPIQEIIERYKQGESQASLARSFGVNRRTIKRMLDSENIYIRSDGEASKARANRAFNSSLIVDSVIDGLLLGDAWIEQKSGQANARLGIEVKNSSEDWLVKISEIFNQHNIKHSISKRPARKKVIQGVETVSQESLVLRTSLYPNFAIQRKRWYPNGKKRVPKDLVINKYTLAHWYWGDGCTDNYLVRIYTNNFTKEGCKFLISSLEDSFNLRFSLSSSGGKPILDLYNNTERERFLSIIREQVPACFQYKVKEPIIIRRSKV